MINTHVQMLIKMLMSDLHDMEPREGGEELKSSAPLVARHSRR